MSDFHVPGTHRLRSSAPLLHPDTRWLILALLLSLLSFSRAAESKESWSGDFTLIIKGSGSTELEMKGVPGGKARTTWNVDRAARGRIVLDRMFKGGGIAGTPDTRNTERYETWIADSKQSLELDINDSGTYFGFFSDNKRVTLDEIHYRCPEPDERHPTGQVRSGILQLDRQTRTYTFETPRMIHRCATSMLRTPKHGPAAWMAKAPFNLFSNAFELEFEVWHGLNLLEAWSRMTGPYHENATELVLSRKFVFDWSNPLLDAQRRAPVEGQLQLVLRKSP